MSQSNKRNKKNNQKDNDILNNIIQSKKPELAIVALLLSGKLKFDSVELFREASLAVSLVGTFNKKDTNMDEDRVNQIVDFLDENGNMTIDEIFKAFKKKVQD